MEASLRSRRWIAPLRAQRHVLGVRCAPSGDMALRQSRLCVTLSASPRTVTHALGTCVGAALGGPALPHEVGRRREAAGRPGGCPGWRGGAWALPPER